MLFVIKISPLVIINALLLKNKFPTVLFMNPKINVLSVWISLFLKEIKMSVFRILVKISVNHIRLSNVNPVKIKAIFKPIYLFNSKFFSWPMNQRKFMNPSLVMSLFISTMSVDRLKFQIAKNWKISMNVLSVKMDFIWVIINVFWTLNLVSLFVFNIWL